MNWHFFTFYKNINTHTVLLCCPLIFLTRFSKYSYLFDIFQVKLWVILWSCWVQGFMSGVAPMRGLWCRAENHVESINTSPNPAAWKKKKILIPICLRFSHLSALLLFYCFGRLVAFKHGPGWHPRKRSVEAHFGLHHMPQPHISAGDSIYPFYLFTSSMKESWDPNFKKKQQQPKQLSAIKTIFSAACYNGLTAGKCLHWIDHDGFYGTADSWQADVLARWSGQ